LGLKEALATATGIGEPGIEVVGLNKTLAGLGGRRLLLGFTEAMATAVRKGEPGTR
jgi:hypothetical protein